MRGGRRTTSKQLTQTLIVETNFFTAISSNVKRQLIKIEIVTRPALQSDPTPDLEPDTLSVVADLMLAQAQEIVTLKAISDPMKDAIVAKLCSQCDDMFSSVMRSMQVCLLLHSQTQGGHEVGGKGGPLANF